MRLPSFLLAWAIAATLTGGAPLESEVEKRQAKVPINPALYPDIQRYANFASAAYKGVTCKVPPFASLILGQVNVKLLTTSVILFKAPDRRELVLSFPGTQGPIDQVVDVLFPALPWLVPDLIDKYCKGCFVHTGGQLAWGSIIQQTKDLLDKELAANPGYTLTLTGHSLGGGLASLAFTSLTEAKYPIKKVFTYGQARVGNQKYADYVDKLAGASQEVEGIYHRVTHQGDGIPQLPGELAGFQHSRTEYYQEDDSSGGEDAQETFRCFGQEAGDCNAATGKGIKNPAHGFYGGVIMGGSQICT